VVFVEFERRSRRKTAHRIKLFVQMLTTTGYAAVGSAIADPLFNSGAFHGGNLFSLSVGLVALALALYYVPDGEYDVPY
jgi:hypothetical protein